MLYVAKEGFATVDEAGTTVRVRAGDIAEAGHWLVDRAPASFRPMRVAFATGQSGDSEAALAEARAAVTDAEKALVTANAAVTDATARIAELEAERDELAGLLEQATHTDPAAKPAAKGSAKSSARK